MRKALIAGSLLLLCSCYDSGFNVPDKQNGSEAVTTTIGNLRAKYAGKSFRIDSDVIVTGTVTSSDVAENCFRTLTVEADGAALEIMAGIDHLHNDFPLGCRVTLHLKGLALGMSHGVLQAGRMPTAGSGYATDYLGSRAALDAVVKRNGETLSPLTPTTLKIEALTLEKCGTLVNISELKYATDQLTESSWAGNKRFCDTSGKEIYTYVRAYASFAKEAVPVGTCTLTGLLQNDGTHYLLKLRDEKDCAY